MSRVEFDQFQRMRQESWESLPRLTRAVRAATDYWTKLQLCVLLSLFHSLSLSLRLYPSLPPSAIKYFIITQWASECKWCNWQLRVKAWSQSWLCKYLSMTDLLAGRGGERQGAGDSQRCAARWSRPGAIRRSAATRGSFLPGDRWPHSSRGPRHSCEGPEGQRSNHNGEFSVEWRYNMSQECNNMPRVIQMQDDIIWWVKQEVLIKTHFKIRRYTFTLFM